MSIALRAHRQLLYREMLRKHHLTLILEARQRTLHRTILLQIQLNQSLAMSSKSKKRSNSKVYAGGNPNELPIEQLRETRVKRLRPNTPQPATTTQHGVTGLIGRLASPFQSVYTGFRQYSRGGGTSLFGTGPGQNAVKSVSFRNPVDDDVTSGLSSSGDPSGSSFATPPTGSTFVYKTPERVSTPALAPE